MPGATDSILINVPAKTIYEVVVDFESYPEFVPNLKTAAVHKKGKQVLGDFEVSMIKTFSYTLSFQFSPYKKIAWQFVSGELFKKNTGHWLFEEVKKNQTKATYHLEVEFSLPVPSILTDKLVGHNLPMMLKKFKERAEEQES